MQKISPLRSSIEAFNKFKASRLSKTDKAQKNESKAQTNPFGITFKGKIVQSDVFVSSTKNEDTTDKTSTLTSIKDKMQNTGKLLASAWVGTINKFSSLKANAIAFGNKIKDSTIAFGNKVKEIGNTEVKIENPFKYTVSNLEKQPVSELRSLLSAEIQGATNEQ